MSIAGTVQGTAQRLRLDSVALNLGGNSGRGAHAFILSKEKKITWKFTDHKHFTAASQVWAIEP